MDNEDRSLFQHFQQKGVSECMIHHIYLDQLISMNIIVSHKGESNQNIDFAMVSVFQRNCGQGTTKWAARVAPQPCPKQENFEKIRPKDPSQM